MQQMYGRRWNRNAGPVAIKLPSARTGFLLARCRQHLLQAAATYTPAMDGGAASLVVFDVSAIAFSSLAKICLLMDFAFALQGQCMERPKAGWR